MKLSDFRRRALRREFPWIDICVGSVGRSQWFDLCDELHVKVADAELLRQVPEWHTHDGAACEYVDQTRVHFVWSDTEVTRDAVACNEKHGSNYAHTPTTHRQGETVGERLLLASELRQQLPNFVAVQYRKYSSMYGTNIRTLTVYKVREQLADDLHQFEKEVINLIETNTTAE